MNQVSRPMQIALGAVLVFALLWFVALRPDPAAEDVAATPVTPTATATAAPNADAGGATAKSALGKTVETAKEGAAAADATAKARETATGEEAPTSTPDSAATADPSAAAPAATTPAAPAKATKTAAKATDDSSERSAAETKADRVIRSIKRDLKARRAVVVLVWAKTGKEDQILKRRVTKEINRRKGKVTVHLIPVGEVGRYDGLLGGLSLGQTPSTIVIAPNNQAKVLGGLVSTARLDRLTSSATLTKPAATTP